MISPTPKGPLGGGSGGAVRIANASGLPGSNGRTPLFTATLSGGVPVSPAPSPTQQKQQLQQQKQQLQLQRQQQQQQIQQQQKAAALTVATQRAATELNDIRERRNWLIHVLYTRQEYHSCLSVIEAQLRDTEGACEYALYVKGLLRRMEGKLTESLTLLQTAVLVGPENAESRKQFARGLFLLGRHREALEAFREAQALIMAKGLTAWEVELHIGLCHEYLGDYEEAVGCLVRSLGLQRIDSTFLHLGRVLLRMKSYDGAIQVYQEALEVSPQNADLQAALGQLYLKTGSVPEAVNSFGKCLAREPTHLRAVVAVASVIQNSGDYDVALSKYRIAVAKAPDSPQLWNNIGACFFGNRQRNLSSSGHHQHHNNNNNNGAGSAISSGVGALLPPAEAVVTSDNNFYAAVACLRKSLILSPFEWIANYNLGVVFLSAGRYVSAFQHLSAAVSLNGQYAPAYMFIGVCLSLMNDIENACRAYEKALAMEDDLVFRVNYAITLLNSNMVQASREQLQRVLPVWTQLTPEQQRAASPALPTAVTLLQSRLARVRPEAPPPPPPQPVAVAAPAAPAAAAAAGEGAGPALTSSPWDLPVPSATLSPPSGGGPAGGAVAGSSELMGDSDAPPGLSSVPVFHPPIAAGSGAGGSGCPRDSSPLSGARPSPHQSTTLASTSISEFHSTSRRGGSVPAVGVLTSPRPADDGSDGGGPPSPLDKEDRTTQAGQRQHEPPRSNNSSSSGSTATARKKATRANHDDDDSNDGGGGGGAAAEEQEHTTTANQHVSSNSNNININNNNNNNNPDDSHSKGSGWQRKSYTAEDVFSVSAPAHSPEQSQRPSHNSDEDDDDDDGASTNGQTPKAADI